MQNRQLDRRTRYSLHAIRTAMLELLREKELDSITVAELCRAADVNRGTFYKYYRDIFDLYEQMEDDFAQRLRELLDQSGEGSFALPELFDKVTQVLLDNRNFVCSSRGGNSARLMGKLMALAGPGLERYIRRFRPELPPAQALFLGEYIIGGCTRVYETWIGGGMELPPEQIRACLTALVGDSLRHRF